MAAIVILGPPCVGKGTIAKKLAEKMKYEHLSIGQALRRKYPMGHEIRNIIDGGNMVSEAILKNILSDYINKNIILDGFPRTVDQCKMLKTIPIRVIYILTANKEVLLERMRNRRVCNICEQDEHINDNCFGTIERRQDDNDPTYLKRLKTYFDNIEAIKKKLYNFYEIDTTNLNPDEVFKIIMYNV